MCGDTGIASASSDQSVGFWTAEREGYVRKSTFVGHNSCVGAVAWVPPNEELPSGGLVSGGTDAKVLVWDLGTGLLVRELTGHELQVTSLAVDEQGDVLSASMDRCPGGFPSFWLVAVLLCGLSEWTWVHRHCF